MGLQSIFKSRAVVWVAVVITGNITAAVALSSLGKRRSGVSRQRLACGASGFGRDASTVKLEAKTAAIRGSNGGGDVVATSRPILGRRAVFAYQREDR